MIVFILIYLASMIGAYLTVRQVFGPNGEWEALSPGATELFLMFLPGANTFVCLVGIVGIVQDFILSLNVKINYNRFFRIKK